jgi:hypothetical protein
MDFGRFIQTDVSAAGLTVNQTNQIVGEGRACFITYFSSRDAGRLKYDVLVLPVDLDSYANVFIFGNFLFLFHNSIAPYGHYWNRSWVYLIINAWLVALSDMDAGEIFFSWMSGDLAESA